MRKIDLSIVVVTMNHLLTVKQLLDRLFNTAKPKIEFEVIVVDNCSTDGTVEFIRDNYPDCKLIVNSERMGFSKNNNLGVHHSSGNIIFICNPDIIPTLNSIDDLHDYLVRDTSIGIICPKLLNADGSVQNTARNFLSLNIIFNRVLTFGRDSTKNKVVRNYLMDGFNSDKIQEVNWAMGAALMMRRDTFSELQGFDENYFLYVEDVDLCLRCWKSNKGVIYYPKSIMTHLHQRDSVRKINKRTWWHLKSLMYFLFKHRLIFKSITFIKNGNVSSKGESI